jgi:hypothetical protein
MLLACSLLSVALAGQPHGAGGGAGPPGPLNSARIAPLSPHVAAQRGDQALVTTDTLPWCQHLATSFESDQQQSPQPDPQAAEYARRGQEMCAKGRVREGILWLRHALIRLSAP